LQEPKHGEVELSYDNQIITAVLVGSFNKKGAEEYTEGVKSIVKQLKGKKYAMLVDNSKLEGGTPEAYQTLENYNQWINNTNIVAKAIVVDSQAAMELIKSLSPSINQQKNKSFYDRKSALEWLKDSLK